MATHPQVIEVNNAAPNNLLRCTRCGAQAYVVVEWQDGRGLLFCAHHGDEHWPKILEHVEGKQMLVSDYRPYLRDVLENAQQKLGV